MSRWLTRALPAPCPVCQLTYHQFRTRHTYQTIFELMLQGDPDDSSTWTYKRRRAVLRFWHRLKMAMWQDHLDTCLHQQKQHRALLRRERMFKSGKQHKQDRKRLKRGRFEEHRRISALLALDEPPF